MITHQAIVNNSATIHKDVLIVQVTNNKLKNMDFTLVNVYNRPGSGNKAVGSLLQVVPAITNIAVVQGDFNLHSPLWDDRVSRGSGLATELFNTLSDCSLNLVNDEGDPTWTNGRGSSSVIDLLFCNDRLVALDPSLDVSLHDRGHSDHALISLIFGRQILRPGRPFITKDSEEEHHFFVSYHHHPHSLSTLPPSSAFSDPPFLSDSWTTMRHKSPSSSTKLSSRAPPPSKSLSPLASPSLSSLPTASLLPPSLSALPSGVCASPASPENLWDDYPSARWEIDNDIYCDSMGCSYDAHKNPRLATVVATVIEFDDCSYQEYEDTLFLCKICNISCRRSINKSKIKSKMPLEQFLRRQRSEDDSFSAEAIDLPLPTPSAADFPPLAPPAPNPGPTPKKVAPKLTKAERTTQAKINALLAPVTPTVKSPVKRHEAPAPKASSPPKPAKASEPPTRKILERPMAKTPSEQTGSVPASASLAPSPLPEVIPSTSPDHVPSPVTPILAVAALQVAHSNACPHDPNTARRKTHEVQRMPSLGVRP
ncbi:hypothetical protein AX14_005629 [Amanita brunnescens Koide BX004]|nr:hypothetical protein AX14_005629 [Amanita brunnescens Koide BX004]